MNCPLVLNITHPCIQPFSQTVVLAPNLVKIEHSIGIPFLTMGPRQLLKDLGPGPRSACTPLTCCLLQYDMHLLIERRTYLTFSFALVFAILGVRHQRSPHTKYDKCMPLDLRYRSLLFFSNASEPQPIETNLFIDCPM